MGEKQSKPNRVYITNEQGRRVFVPGARMISFSTIGPEVWPDWVKGTKDFNRKLEGSLEATPAFDIDAFRDVVGNVGRGLADSVRTLSQAIEGMTARFIAGFSLVHNSVHWTGLGDGQRDLAIALATENYLTRKALTLDYACALARADVLRGEDERKRIVEEGRAKLRSRVVEIRGW